MKKTLNVNIYKRASGNHTKLNYYDMNNKVYITPSEILSSKKAGHEIIFHQRKELTNEEYSKAINNVVSFGTKQDLISKKDPTLTSRIIMENGYFNYIRKLEKLCQKKMKNHK